MAKKIYVARESDTKWTNPSGDLLMSLPNLAAGAVRIGARKDFGEGSTPEWFTWRMIVQFATAPVVGETVAVYLSTSDGTYPDGNVGTADAAGDTNTLPNLHFLGCLTVTSTDSGHSMIVSGVCRITTRYVSPVIHNNTADAFHGGANTTHFSLTPIPSELQ